MLAETVNSWDIVLSFLQGVYIVFIAFFKLLFTTPLLPFTVIGIISSLLKLKPR